MRLRELALSAYGPFTGVSLDFSAPGLHVVFGRNEAGKSTALRAIAGLLFGIPKNTTDAHLHAMPHLRIGATLEGDHGEILRVVRRKGNTSTLLDPAGAPVDEASLRRLLGGVNEELFGRMFGLDHETLRQGAQALLLGRGDVGESLFGASLGSEVHDVLRGLDAEASALFAPAANATRPPLNAALRSFAEAQKQVRALSESQALLTQQAGLDEAIAERARCEAERRALLAEQNRLRRAQRVRPLLARRAMLKARRDALGEVVALPESAPRDREEALRESEGAEQRAKRLGAEIRELEATRASLVVPESLLEQEIAIEDVVSRLGAHRAALVELPAGRAELAALEDEARAISKRARPDVALDDAPSLRVDAAKQARVKKLALKAPRLEEKMQQAERVLEAKRAALERCAAEQPEAQDAPEDLDALRLCVSRAQRAGNLDEQHRRGSAEVERLRDVARARAGALGLLRGADAPQDEDLDAVRSLAAPPLETVERFAQLWASFERDEGARKTAEAALARVDAQIARELESLDRTGDLPTPERLASARARRDEGWRLVRAAWGKRESVSSRAAEFDASRSLAEAYEQSVDDADSLSDRLRSDADRVARAVALAAQRGTNAADRARLAEESERDERAFDVTRREWNALWGALRTPPLPPAEMRAWLGRHAAVASAIEQLRAAEIDALGVARQRGELAQALRHAMGSAHAAAATTDAEDLSTLVARADARARTLEQAERSRKDGARALLTLEGETKEAARELEAHAAALASWRASWATELADIGLASTASPEDATAMIDELGELYRRVDAAAKIRARLAVLESAAQAFDVDVARLVKTHASGLVGAPSDHAADALASRFRDGRNAASERRQVDVLLKEKREAAQSEGGRHAAAEARLSSLMRLAGVSDVAALELAEQRAKDARDVDAERRVTDEQLAELGHQGEAEGDATPDADALDADLEEVETKIDDVERRHSATLRSIGGLEQGLEALRSESAAAQAASLAQESLARARTAAERYVRVRLAAIILAREIERYREKNQGPILTRASVFFARMTLGAYASLRVGYDDRDKPALRCVRAGSPGGPDPEREVDIEALSDGTRDQLYLALRLATLERYAETSTTMPFVVDDILVHFDDERARAALAAMSDVAARTQVLLFTHHARVVELAIEASPTTHVHSLEDVKARGRDVAAL